MVEKITLKLFVLFVLGLTKLRIINVLLAESVTSQRLATSSPALEPLGIAEI